LVNSLSIIKFVIEIGFQCVKKWYDEESKSSNDDNMAESIKNIKSAGNQSQKVQVPSYVTKVSKK
jgi:hypothetical protein